MSRKKQRQTPEFQWEQALIDDYYDYRWRQVLNPLYDKFKRWEASELEHHDMDQAIHETHKQNQELYRLFTETRAFLARLIQWDEEWFNEWVATHPPPSGIVLAPPRARFGMDNEETDMESNEVGR